MTRQLHATSMNMQAFAEAGVPLTQTIPLQNLERLAHESIGLKPDLMVNWQAVGVGVVVLRSMVEIKRQDEAQLSLTRHKMPHEFAPCTRIPITLAKE